MCIRDRKKGEPAVHEALKGFDIKVSTFGEMQTNFEVDTINEFLNDNVEDKKLTKQTENTEEE